MSFITTQSQTNLRIAMNWMLLRGGAMAFCLARPPRGRAVFGEDILPSSCVSPPRCINEYGINSWGNPAMA